MTSDQEKNVLGTLYDRLYDALTYVPGGGKSGDFDKATTLLQMTKNFVLNPDDYSNAFSSINPNGTQTAAYAFSSMVDVVPAMAAEWVDSSKRVSDAFKFIVENANAEGQEDAEARARYGKAYQFLNSTRTIPSFDGETTVTGPSPIALTYAENQTSYVNAIGGYRLAYTGYDLTDIKDQRAWQAAAPGLQNAVDQAWNKWVREGKQNVEQAENVMRTSINNAVAAAIRQAQEGVSDSYALAGLAPGAARWFPSYAMPTNWCDATCQGSRLTLSSKTLATQTSDQASEYSRQSTGLFWSGKRKESGKTEATETSMQASEFELSAQLIVVRIRRPWLNPILFSMKDWSQHGVPQNGISNGQLKDNDRLLPLIPTAFVVAKDVSIRANFSEQDTRHFNAESSSEEGWGWGWGPFSGGGSYASQKSTKDTFRSTYADGVLKFPGLQVVAWVSSVTPASPPKGGR